MSPTDAMTVMLLVAHFLALGVAIMVFLWILFRQRQNRVPSEHLDSAVATSQPRLARTLRPTRWLAVRTLESATVRAALGTGGEFKISPRVNGWAIVTGPGLPSPADDVDACFRFLADASRKLGHLQFFDLDGFTGHHAWVRLDDGCVTRAYAWAGETIWNQGTPTSAEHSLGMKCHDYGEDAESLPWNSREQAAVNLEKVPRLAARWSLDPETLPRGSLETDGRSGCY